MASWFNQVSPAGLLTDDIFWNLTQKALPFLQPAPERLDKSFEALPALYLRGRLCVVGQRRRDRQPEADEERQGLGR